MENKEEKGISDIKKSDELIMKYLPTFDQIGILDDTAIILIAPPLDEEATTVVLSEVGQSTLLNRYDMSQPFIVAKVGKDIDKVKRGDIVWCDGNLQGQATIINFSKKRKWENAIGINYNPILVPYILINKDKIKEYNKEVERKIDIMIKKERPVTSRIIND